MTQRPARARRSQLSVPGSSEKMLAKAAASAADHVFCDLEDAVAPSAKVEARQKIVHALNTLDWGGKTRCVRINDVTTQWCHGDIIEIVEGAGANVDTIMLTKPYCAADVIFLDRMLGQLEQKLSLDRRIGIEVLIEEVEALQNVEEIARCSDRMEALIFGMGDYSGSQGIETKNIGSTDGYPGDIFHYARFRITMAARAAGIDAVDGPFANFKDDAAYRQEAERAKALGMVGKWAIHPSQIQPALDVFSPSREEVDRARRIEQAYREAESAGLGAVQVDGVMIDVAVLRLTRNTLRKAELIGM
ncbi:MULTISPECIES: HpcH/HpaI aldolase/citrate lyase family protein [Sphingopyxis]|jgi:citrate lyase subunit beta/citryl-CoA lyase|uniref:HpcH/HpaI aldolase/citrate lyase family protein n=1 Tax=Sphingopyxis TaxID=165697 RepID=UPI00082996CF|nr:MULTISPECIES: CoA ester lyase [Sphingopyxis]AVA13345.1 CoA ester lyase [Sphingopyxis sp. MG]ODU28804.1 MAG: citryl-CoA lyase [Sphingopyxis sp. SCN 67-31]QUM71627.1 CoA ester lyase [Sphingopyxis granuli]UNK81140.1 CoA ester lyase [Sphingopyxis granuli]